MEKYFEVKIECQLKIIHHETDKKINDIFV